MTRSEDLWAVGYDDVERANQVRDEIVRLGWGKNYLLLLDVAVVAQPRAVPGRVQPPGLLRGGLHRGPGARRAASRRDSRGHDRRRWTAIGLTSAGISDDFVREVRGLMKPGTSAIFLLDCEGDMDVILAAIRGLGGTVLKTNVDAERARLIQSTLAAPSAQTGKAGGE
jgi:uncharacterized membrane protein